MIPVKSFIENISIHAPLRERRVNYCYNIVKLRISIHAPLRERLAGAANKWAVAVISIHAPLRERLSSVLVLLYR